MIQLQVHLQLGGGDSDRPVLPILVELAEKIHPWNQDVTDATLLSFSKILSLRHLNLHDCQDHQRRHFTPLKHLVSPTFGSEQVP